MFQSEKTKTPGDIPLKHLATNRRPDAAASKCFAKPTNLASPRRLMHAGGLKYFPIFFSLRCFIKLITSHKNNTRIYNLTEKRQNWSFEAMDQL